MLDGPPFAKLVILGQPVGNIWHRVQDTPAEMLGSTVPTTVQRRSDHKTHVQPEKLRRRKRDGNDTVPAHKRRRLDAVRDGGGLLGVTGVGHPALDAQERECHERQEPKVTTRLEEAP